MDMVDTHTSHLCYHNIQYIVVYYVASYAPISVLPHLPPYWQKVGI